MKIGFVGLGKLGLPVALSMENRGHDVVGTDINPDVESYIKGRFIPYMEEGTPELLKKTNIRFVGIPEVITHSDIVFVPIQTPHDPKFEGVTQLPEERKDFDYSYLVAGVKSIAEEAKKQEKRIILVVISTVLPGTFGREIKPLLNEYIDFCYNPSFIAMGTTRADFEYPELVLLGCDDYKISDQMVLFYKTITDAPAFVTSVINAELIKVIYNTFISTKIAFINTVMEICEKIGANVDAVSDALALANVRVTSPKYLKGGMGDGGGCHPRDNIALSWLAEKLDLSYDFFESIMLARQENTEWLGEMLVNESDRTGLPIHIMGISYKKDINLTVGSPVSLLKDYLTRRFVKFTESDPFVLHNVSPYYDEYKPAVYFIGMNHSVYSGYGFPPGSVIMDPWGIIQEQSGVTLKRIGRYVSDKS